MVRVLLILTTFLLALPVMADDDKDEDRDGTSVRTECEQQANQKDLTGKDRRKFVKECAKEERHGRMGGKDDKRRGEASRSDTSPSQAQSAQPAPQTKPAPAPAVTAPAQSAPAPAQPAAAPAPTPAAQPATPAPAATAPAVKPPAPKTVLTPEQKQAQCTEEAKQANVSMMRRKVFMYKFMAG